MATTITQCSLCGGALSVHGSSEEEVESKMKELQNSGSMCYCVKVTMDADHERIRRELWKEVYLAGGGIKTFPDHDANAAVDAFDKRFGEATQC